MKLCIEGLRVRLRELRLTDLIDVYVNIRDKEVAKWSIPPASRLAQNTAGRFIWRFVGHIGKALRVVWQMLFPPKVRSEFKLGIVLKETGKSIGIVSLSHIDRQSGCAEIGIWIGKKYWAKGIMFEAEGLLIKWAFDVLGMHKICAQAHHENVASIITMKKLGFQIEGTLREERYIGGKRIDIIHLGVSRGEFKPIQA